MTPKIYQGAPPLHGLNTQQQLNTMREGILNYTRMIRPQAATQLQAATRVIDMPVFVWDTVRRCCRAKSGRPTMERVSRALEMQRLL